MNVLLWVFVACLIGLAIALVVYDRRQTRQHRLRVRKMYASPLVGLLQPTIQKAREHSIQLVAVDKTGVTIRFLNPVHSDLDFRVKQHGFAYLTPPQQSALRTILEEQLPILTDGQRYRLVRKNVHLLNGTKEYAYNYTITHAYRNTLSRMPYYAKNMVPFSW